MLAAFTGYDWLIVVVYIILGTIPGFLLRKYIRGQAEFLVAGRTLSVFLATATLTATELGLITVMYFAQLGFLQGFSAFSIGLIAFCCTMFVGLTGFLVSGFRASGVTTFAEYYEKRYSRGVRLLGGLILAAAGILNYGVFIRIEAEFVRILTGIPDVQVTSLASGATVHLDSLKLVMSALVLLVLGYTLLGGMVSVVVTDYVQFIVLTIGMGITTWLVLTESHTGGVAGIIEVVNRFRPEYGVNPFKRVPMGQVMLGLGGIYIAWQILHWTASSCWQTSAFRTAAADSPRTAKVMWSLTAVNYFGRAIVPMLWGVAALAFFVHQGVDLDRWDAERGVPGTVAGRFAAAPAEAAAAPMPTDVQLAGWDPKREDRAMQAMPRYMAAILPAGVAGLLVAGMLAALMSTHSAYLLAWSGVLAEDLLAPLLRVVGVSLSDRTRLWITRFFIVCLGAYLMIFGLWYKTKTDIWSFLSLTGSMYFAGAATLLAFGLYWKRANVAGAFAGIICGAAPGLFNMIIYLSVLAMGPRPAGTVGAVRDLVYWINAGLSEAVVALIGYPLAILGMVVGSILYERMQGGRPPGEYVGVAPSDGLTPAPSVAAGSEGPQ